MNQKVTSPQFSCSRPRGRVSHSELVNASRAPRFSKFWKPPSFCGKTEQQADAFKCDPFICIYVWKTSPQDTTSVFS